MVKDMAKNGMPGIYLKFQKAMVAQLLVQTGFGGEGGLKILHEEPLVVMVSVIDPPVICWPV